VVQKTDCFWQQATARSDRLLGSAKPGHIRAIDQLSKRLTMVIKEKGGHVEFHLD